MRITWAIVLVSFGALSFSQAAEALNLHPGKTVLPPLSGAALTNQIDRARELRNLPSTSPSQARTFSEGRPVRTLKYRLFKPVDYEPGKEYPLVLYLHEGGPRDNFDDL